VQKEVVEGIQGGKGITLYNMVFGGVNTILSTLPSLPSLQSSGAEPT